MICEFLIFYDFDLPGDGVLQVQTQCIDMIDLYDMDTIYLDSDGLYSFILSLIHY